jgi:hypothetical protein
MKISFKAFNRFAGISGNRPIPAVGKLPFWYKAMPRFVNKDKKFKLSNNLETNATIKWCNPFLDSLTAGYLITLENDVQVSRENEEVSFVWKAGGDGFISTHNKQQVAAEMVPDGFDPQPYKFLNNWSVKTPAGYSALFSHPLNRADLPFYTLAGVVDTDDYTQPVNFPFFIRENFEGIIPAGTPIAQVIPIKREGWTHEIGGFSEDFVIKSSGKFNSTIYRAYKNLFWKRKDYR